MWRFRLWTDWRPALVIVKPETVVAWHRRGFRMFWTWKSRRHTGRPTVAGEVRVLIARCRKRTRDGAPGRLLFVLVILAHARRHVVHVAVTAHPTAAWTSQQLREAFPWDHAPRYVIHDRDHAFACRADTTKAMDIEEVLRAPHAPWQNAYVERFIGAVRRECLDHVIVFSATGLRGSCISMARITNSPAPTCR